MKSYEEIEDEVLVEKVATSLEAKRHEEYLEGKEARNLEMREAFEEGLEKEGIYNVKENIVYTQEDSMERLFPLILCFFGVVTITFSILSKEINKVPLFIGITVFFIGVFWNINISIKNKIKLKDQIEGIGEDHKYR